METSTYILIISICAILILIYLRFYKKENDSIKPGGSRKKDNFYDSPETETTYSKEQENKAHDIPETETISTFEQEENEINIPEEEITRIIPDEEIEKYTDEQEKEVTRIDNYFISNGFENLVGDNFFNIQENILMDDFCQFDPYFEIDQIFRITENKFVAIIDLPHVKKQADDQQERTVKEILGIIECPNSLGNAWIEPYSEEKEKAPEENEEAELIADVFLPETDIKIGKNLLHAREDNDPTAVESLSKEIEKLSRDYIAYINGKSVYIRINRPASLDDLKTMIEILMNFKY